MIESTTPEYFVLYVRQLIDTVGVDWVAFGTDCPADMAIERPVS